MQLEDPCELKEVVILAPKPPLVRDCVVFATKLKMRSTFWHIAILMRVKGTIFPKKSNWLWFYTLRQRRKMKCIYIKNYKSWIFLFPVEYIYEICSLLYLCMPMSVISPYIYPKICILLIRQFYSVYSAAYFISCMVYILLLFCDCILLSFML